VIADTVNIALSDHQVIVNKACDIFTRNSDKAITLNGLASMVATNRNTLTKAFREITGVPPMTWLREFRLRRAAELISNTDISIQNIALDVGCVNQAHFSTIFKKYYNLSPKEYRNIYGIKYISD